MKLFLIHRSYAQPQFRNSNGVSGCLVLADDEAEARSKAQAAAKTGETTIYPEWTCSLLADSGSLLGGRGTLLLGEIFDDVRRCP